MNKTKLFTAMAATMGIGWGIAAQAAAFTPAIGLDPTGSGGTTSSFIYADLWTNNTDTGVDKYISGGDPLAGILQPLTVGALHSFHTQMSVASARLGPDIVDLGDINRTTPADGYEITKEISFQDVIATSTIPPGSSTNNVTFNLGGTAGNAPVIQAAGPQLTIYYDNIHDGSKSVPGNGGSTVRCYGGTSPPDSNVCTGGPDGIPILTAKLIFDSSSFTATTPGVLGNGSFQLVFEITPTTALPLGYDPNYIDISNLLPNGTGTGKIITDKITGTLVQPPFYSPTVMWDGTTNTGNSSPTSQTFKVDSSQNFGVAATPEPSSVALLGAGLLSALGFYRRKNKQ